MFYWLRKNLFSRWYNSVLTVLLAALAGYLSFYAIRYVFFTAEWKPVRANLTLFMIGTFPRAEQWRVIVQILLMCGSFGLFWGASITSARDRAEQAGLPYRLETGWETFKRWWPLLLLLAVLLLTAIPFVGYARLLGPAVPVLAAWDMLPLVFALSAVALMLALRYIAKRIPSKFRIGIWILGTLSLIASWQVVSGTGGYDWLWGAGLLGFIAVYAVRQKDLSRKRLSLMLQVAGIAVGATISWVVYRNLLSFGGVEWDKWSGFHLNLTAAAISIIAAFPLGLLLALGRRSNLPAVKWLSVTYIELIRGVPLIGLLFVANSLLGFFWPSDTPRSQLTRAIVIMSLFTAAYLAEIIRGGLASVPLGQREGGQSVGLSPLQNTSLIIMPQALRSVIPAIVGQFISLLKDSSLLSTIAIIEIIQARENAHAQAEFTTIGIAETLVFVAFAFWCFAFVMSRESQRLEGRLGIGRR